MGVQRACARPNAHDGPRGSVGLVAHGLATGLLLGLLRQLVVLRLHNLVQAPGKDFVVRHVLLLLAALRPHHLHKCPRRGWGNGPQTVVHRAREASDLPLPRPDLRIVVRDEHHENGVVLQRPLHAAEPEGQDLVRISIHRALGEEAQPTSVIQVLVHALLNSYHPLVVHLEHAIGSAHEVHREMAHGPADGGQDGQLEQIVVHVGPASNEHLGGELGHSEDRV
mmetsp:Transcript_56361/g.163498  ORF Transcript_56361/g.163498 Transcript_56361/m.163498 type:complete len:224 (+) Transcript_56361:56-727(+)